MRVMHTLALSGAAILVLLVCGTRLGAVSDRVHIPQCPTVTSLLQLPDMQACRQVMALAADPWQGCPALRPLPDPDNPTSRMLADEAAELDTAEAEQPHLPGRHTPWHFQAEEPPRHSVRASQLCCTAAQLFGALRCNCWQGLDQRIVDHLMDQAALCGPLPTETEAVNPADSITQRTREEVGSQSQSAAVTAQVAQQQAQPPWQQRQHSGSNSTGRGLDASGDGSSSGGGASSGSSSSSGGGASSGSSSSGGGGDSVRNDPGSGHSGWNVAKDALQALTHREWKGAASPVATSTVSAGQQPVQQRLTAIGLYAAVISAAANRGKRDAVRATWGADKRLHRLIFVCAKPRDSAAFDALRAEAVRQRDLVIVPHVWEHYDNITHQSFEATRAAALDPGMTHLLKVDDDSYVRVGPLLRRLQSAPAVYAFMGAVEIPGGRPHRDPKSKWHVSEDEWGKASYPPWAHGAGYVLTADLVRDIAAGAALKPQKHRLFKLEDIAMGSWVQFVGKERGVQINYVRDERFNYFGCSSSDLVSHYFDPGLMCCTWASGGRCCFKSEGRRFAAQLEKFGGNMTKLQAWAGGEIRSSLWGA